MNGQEQKEILNEIVKEREIVITQATLIIREHKEALKQAQQDLIQIINYYNSIISGLKVD